MNGHNHPQPAGSAQMPIIVDDTDDIMVISDDDDDGVVVISSDSESDNVLQNHKNKRKRPQTFTESQAKRPRLVNRGIPLAKLDDESSSSDSESEGDRTGLSFHNDLDLNIHEWSVAPVGVLTHIPRKTGEYVLGPAWRRKSHIAGRSIMEQTGNDLLQQLGLLSPYVHSHGPRIHQHTMSVLGHSHYPSYPLYRRCHDSAVNKKRVGGCPNVITQNGQFIAVAAAVHGANEDNSISPANSNGLIFMSSRDGHILPMMSLGHTRRPTRAANVTDLDWNTPSNQNESVFESVFDVQFDPGCPTRFLSAGNDGSVYVWIIEEAADGQRRVRSSIDPVAKSRTERFQQFATRPHFIRFNPNPQHWREKEHEISTHVVTDGEGKFTVEFASSKSSLLIEHCTVDFQKNRQVSSICWGVGPTQDTIFAGTETCDYTDAVAGGCQSGYRITADGKVIPLLYTSSRDEVEELALNPQGNILASFTRSCDASIVSCKRCDRRDVFSDHELSLYSVSNPAEQRTTRKPSSKRVQNSNLIASIALPKFKSSDSFNEAGIIVSAAWSPCGTYIAAARDDDSVDIFDHRFLGPPIMRLRHSTTKTVNLRPALGLDGEESRCCLVPEKHPKNGITALQWTTGSGLLTGGGDGCVRLWDTRQSEVGVIVRQLETAIAAMNIGDISRNELPLIIADEDGLVEMCNFKGNWDADTVQSRPS